MKQDYECSSNREPICPYCGKIVHDAWELDIGDEDSTETECYGCEKEFRVTCSVTVTYSTEPIEGWPEDEPA